MKAALLALLLIASAACAQPQRSHRSGPAARASSRGHQAPARARSARDRPARAVVSASPRATGRFHVVHRELTEDPHNLGAILRESKGLEAMAGLVNQTFNLQSDVAVVFGSCHGVANAFYSREHSALVMCQELLDQIYHLDEDNYLMAFSFILLHEIGHALIDKLSLPITGREEDAADQFATFITSFSDEGVAIALHGAATLALLGSAAQGEPTYWDEHALDEQRFYNVMCWVFGNQPAKYSFVVANQWLPYQRAQRCSDEFSQLASAWSRLLEPHIKSS